MALEAAVSPGNSNLMSATTGGQKTGPWGSYSGLSRHLSARPRPKLQLTHPAQKLQKSGEVEIGFGLSTQPLKFSSQKVSG